MFWIAVGVGVVIYAVAVIFVLACCRVSGDYERREEEIEEITLARINNTAKRRFG